MKTATACALGLLMCLATGHASARQAAGFDLSASSDAEDTSVLKAGVEYDFSHSDPGHYHGVRLERATFEPSGGAREHHDRLYYRFAGGNNWQWNGMLGTDGDTWLGAASIRSGDDFSQEYFIERDIVETRMGLDRGLYQTLVGAAYDLPLDDRNVVTVVAALQDFTGSNHRQLLRGRYTWVAREDWGLSAQLRTRYFHSSHPREFDYYSPRWYAEAIPTLQLRRFRGGWMYLLAGGVGRQRDSETGWRAARFLEAAVASPKTGDWFVQARFLHSNTASTVGSGEGYHYSQASLEFLRQF